MFGRKSNTEQKVDLLIDGLRVIEKKVDSLTLLLHTRGNPVPSAAAEPKTEIEILSDELDEEIAKQPPTPVPEMEIQKPTPTPETKPEPKVEEPKVELKPEPKIEPETKPKVELDISTLQTTDRIILEVIKKEKTTNIDKLKEVWPLNEYSEVTIRRSLQRIKQNGFLDEVNEK